MMMPLRHVDVERAMPMPFAASYCHYATFYASAAHVARSMLLCYMPRAHAVLPRYASRPLLFAMISLSFAADTFIFCRLSLEAMLR